jgi:hypothetical protein
MVCRVVRHKFNEVSKERNASIIRTPNKTAASRALLAGYYSAMMMEALRPSEILNYLTARRHVPENSSFLFNLWFTVRPVALYRPLSSNDWVVVCNELGRM